MNVLVTRSSCRRAVLLLAVALTGCSVGPDYRTPVAPDSTGFTEAPLPVRTTHAATSGGAAQNLMQGRDIPGDWWTLFRSSQVTGLVNQALKANPDVAAAQATLREARETTRAEVGSLFPQLGLSLQSQRQQASLAAFGFGNGSTTYSTTSASLNVSYTLDAFGGIRRQIEQLGA